MKIVILSLVLLTGVGCSTVGSTRMVKSNPQGGRVMIIGSNTWMEKKSLEMANIEMTKKCPAGFEITEEGLMDRPASVALAGKTHVQEKYPLLKLLFADQTSAD